MVKKQTFIAVTAGLMVSLSGVSIADASSNPFKTKSLSSGYSESPSSQATKVDHHLKSSVDDEEGKGGVKKTEGSCGEGKCGGDKPDKKAEGSCGEGKCGHDKTGAAKCGEGKCG